MKQIYNTQRNALTFYFSFSEKTRNWKKNANLSYEGGVRVEQQGLKLPRVLELSKVRAHHSLSAFKAISPGSPARKFCFSEFIYRPRFQVSLLNETPVWLRGTFKASLVV